MTLTLTNYHDADSADDDADSADSAADDDDDDAAYDGDDADDDDGGGGGGGGDVSAFRKTTCSRCSARSWGAATGAWPPTACSWTGTRTRRWRVRSSSALSRASTSKALTKC